MNSRVYIHSELRLGETVVLKLSGINLYYAFLFSFFIMVGPLPNCSK